MKVITGGVAFVLASKASKKKEEEAMQSLLSNKELLERIWKEINSSVERGEFRCTVSIRGTMLYRTLNIKTTLREYFTTLGYRIRINVGRDFLGFTTLLDLTIYWGTEGYNSDDDTDSDEDEGE